MLAAEQGRAMHSLLVEALDALFERYGKPPVPPGDGE
ncbi:ribbon-helix-helix domain-containing protein [Acidisoma sp. S159]